MIQKQRKEKIVPTGKKSSEVQEYRKNNDVIGSRVTSGKLTLLGRKLFNVMIYQAQKMGKPGENAPLKGEVYEKYFWIPLAEVIRDTNYGSNDTEILKQHIEEFQKIRIHTEDNTQWTSESLVSSVKLINTAGLKKRGGTVWLGFAFPPEVHEEVMRPRQYTKLSLYYQNNLRSGYSFALYEICRRYATNPTHLTYPDTYRHWYAALTGSALVGDPPPYKYFKRDILKNSIAEINKVTDIDIELIEHKDGTRSVQRLQFAVNLSQQEILPFANGPLIDSDLIEKVKAVGFSFRDASDICAEYDEKKIRNALLLLKKRIAAKNSPPIDSPVAYFRWSLKQNTDSAITEVDIEEQEKKAVDAKPKVAPVPPSTMEKFLTMW